MNTYPSIYSKKISEEISETPEEYLPALLAMVRLFRESVTLKPANESFSQGLKEALNNGVGDAVSFLSKQDGADKRHSARKRGRKSSESRRRQIRRSRRETWPIER